MCPIECTHGFTKIKPCDLVFDSTIPILNYGLISIRINILTKFHEDWTKTMPSRVYTWVF